MRQENELSIETIDKYLDETDIKSALKLLLNLIKLKRIEWIDIKKYIQEEGSNSFSIEEKIAILENCIKYELIKYPYSNASINLPSNMTIGLEIESVGANSLMLRRCKIDNWESKKDDTLWSDNLQDGGVEFIHSKFNRK